MLLGPVGRLAALFAWISWRLAPSSWGWAGDQRPPHGDDTTMTNVPSRDEIIREYLNDEADLHMANYLEALKNAIWHLQTEFNCLKALSDTQRRQTRIDTTIPLDLMTRLSKASIEAHVMTQKIYARGLK